MLRRLVFLAVSSLLLCSAAPIHADTFNVVAAGALPGSAADLTGDNVTQITGTIPDTTDPLLGVEMFKIDVTNYVDFSAITSGEPFGITDTNLALFDSSGSGIYFNDDIDGGDTLSCLPAADGSNPCPATRPAGVGPTSDGIYYLAISRSSNMPLSATGEIFTVLESTDVVGPDLTMGGGSPITGWDGGAFTSADTDLTGFDITLTGVSAEVPEPGVLALLAVGLCFMIWRTRRSALYDISQS